ALLGNTVIFQTPDILTISYIKNNPNFYNYCDQQLEDVVEIDECHSFIACKGLSDLANNDPPTNFSNINGIGGDFDKWAGSKEYRGYILIPSFNIKCNAEGYLVLANPDYHNQENPTKNPEKVADAEHNPYGYTKIPQAPWGTRWLYQTCPVEYEQADIYTEDPTFNGFQSKPINSNTCLNIHNFRTSRLSPCARRAQQEITKTDALFIFTNINMKVCCDHQVSITIDRSIFPQTCLYIDEKMSGGSQPDPSKLSKAGHGKIAHSSKSLIYNEKVEK
ncbi:9826_t:CDS:2, partial [Dentiscutata erythropus]